MTLSKIPICAMIIMITGHVLGDSYKHNQQQLCHHNFYCTFVATPLNMFNNQFSPFLWNIHVTVNILSVGKYLILQALLTTVYIAELVDRYCKASRSTEILVLIYQTAGNPKCWYLSNKLHGVIFQIKKKLYSVPWKS